MKFKKTNRIINKRSLLAGTKWVEECQECEITVSDTDVGEVSIFSISSIEAEEEKEKEDHRRRRQLAKDEECQFAASIAEEVGQKSSPR